MKTQKYPEKQGFTLVELLVVIAIIATIAAVSFSVGPKMLSRSKQAKSLQNMRQIGILIAGYAAENSNRIPAVQIHRTEEDPPEWPEWQYWHHIAMLDTNPQLTVSKLMDNDWWKREKPLMLNPLQPPSKITHYWTGYGMNSNIAYRLAPVNGGYAYSVESRRYSPRLDAVPDPARTPLAASRNDFMFTGTFEKPEMAPFLVDGKFDLVFVDGHVELITPLQYTVKNFDKQPVR